jgi:GAF domain-containing protein
MSIRLRLTLAMVLIGLIPVAFVLFLANRNFTNLKNLVIDTNEQVMSQVPENVAQSLSSLNDQVAKRTSGNAVRLTLYGGILGILAISAGILFGTTISIPILKMVKATDQATQGFLEAFQPSDDPSEIGALSRSIYAMTIQLTEGMENLEQQATERTREISRRNDQLEVAAQIGREVSTILDVNVLLNEITQLISERFGYYHVAIFLVDDVGEYAVMRAANSQGGKHLLSLGHKLKVGEAGIVGHVAQSGKARVAYDVATDQVFFRNPELPETRSEAALTLRIRERVIGVLDIQSIQLSAFSLDDMRVLQIVADQVALAVENTRLFAENQQARRDLEQAYGQRVIGSWMRRLRNAPLTYVFNRLGVEIKEATSGDQRLDLNSDVLGQDDQNYQISLPISIRGEVIGSLILKREDGAAAWNEEDLSIINDVLEQIEPALESARLLEETQARAMREQAVNVISTQVRRSAGIDSILQNTVRELGKVLGSSRTFIQLDIKSQDELPG